MTAQTEQVITELTELLITAQTEQLITAQTEQINTAQTEQLITAQTEQLITQQTEELITLQTNQLMQRRQRYRQLSRQGQSTVNMVTKDDYHLSFFFSTLTLVSIINLNSTYSKNEGIYTRAF